MFKNEMAPGYPKFPDLSSKSREERSPCDCPTSHTREPAPTPGPGATRRLSSSTRWDKSRGLGAVSQSPALSHPTVGRRRPRGFSATVSGHTGACRARGGQGHGVSVSSPETAHEPQPGLTKPQLLERPAGQRVSCSKAQGRPSVRQSIRPAGRGLAAGGAGRGCSCPRPWPRAAGHAPGRLECSGRDLLPPRRSGPRSRGRAPGSRSSASDPPGP